MVGVLGCYEEDKWQAWFNGSPNDGRVTQAPMLYDKEQNTDQLVAIMHDTNTSDCSKCSLHPGDDPSLVDPKAHDLLIIRNYKASGTDNPCIIQR